MLDLFPLWGSTWLFGKGDHEDAYPSVSKAVPTHLIKVTFPHSWRGGNIIFEWAIFTGLSFKSTGHLLNEAHHQFSQNKIEIDAVLWAGFPFRNEFTKASETGRTIQRDTLMSIVRRTVSDSLWTCDSAFMAGKLEYHGEMYMSYFCENSFVDTTRSWSEMGDLWSRDTIWHKSKPTAWGRLPNTEAYRKEYHFYHETIKQGIRPDPLSPIPPDTVVFYKTLDPDASTHGIVEHCIGDYCYENIRCDTQKLPDFYFWQIHLFPVVKWFPRNPSSGTPIMGYYAGRYI
jgi:hypothetical protein